MTLIYSIENMICYIVNFQWMCNISLVPFYEIYIGYEKWYHCSSSRKLQFHQIQRVPCLHKQPTCFVKLKVDPKYSTTHSVITSLLHAVHARRHDTSTLSSRLVFAWTTFPVAYEHALSRVKYHGTCMAHPKRGISHVRNMESCVHE